MFRTKFNKKKIIKYYLIIALNLENIVPVILITINATIIAFFLLQRKDTFCLAFKPPIKISSFVLESYSKYVCCENE